MRTKSLRWALFVVVLLVAAMIPLQSSTYYTLLLSLAAIYAIVGIGLGILAGYTGQVSLGHAGFYAVGAYVGSLLTTQVGLSFWLTIPVAVGASMMMGALVALPSLKVEGPYLAMVSIAFGIIVHSIVVEWSDITGGTQGILHIPKISIGSIVFSLQAFYWLMLLLVGGGMILAQNLWHSPQGQSFLAVKDNEIGAESLGLSTYRLKTIAFIISAAYAGLAGVLFAHLQGFISPEAFELDTSFFFYYYRDFRRSRLDYRTDSWGGDSHLSTGSIAAVSRFSAHYLRGTYRLFSLFYATRVNGSWFCAGLQNSTLVWATRSPSTSRLCCSNRAVSVSTLPRKGTSFNKYPAHS